MEQNYTLNDSNVINKSQQNIATSITQSKKSGKVGRPLGKMTECKICSKKFSGKGLSYHLAITHYKNLIKERCMDLFDKDNLVCKLCKRYIKNDFTFIAHIGGMHEKALEFYNENISDEKVAVPSDVDNKLNQKPLLKLRRMKMNEYNLNQKSTLKLKRMKMNKRFLEQCRICRKKFSTKGLFIQHLSLTHCRPLIEKRYGPLFDKKKMSCMLCDKPLKHMIRNI